MLPAVEVVSVNLLQDTVCRRARVTGVGAVRATDELVSRLSRTERRILVEAASPLSLAVFRPVLEHLSEPRLESWFTTLARSWDDWLPRTSTLTVASNGSHTLRIQVRKDGAQFDQIVVVPTSYLNTRPEPAGNEATTMPKP